MFGDDILNKIVYIGMVADLFHHGHLNLIKTDFSKLKLFTNKKKSIWLVISGTGRKKAFEASRALNKTSKDYSSPLWINIGIAGHENFNVGSIYEIKKVILNHNKKKALYTNSLSSYFNVHTGCNVNKEEKLYKNSYIYDMESFGFLSAVPNLEASLPIQRQSTAPVTYISPSI